MMEMGLTDETGRVEYVNLSTVPLAPRSVQIVKATDDDTAGTGFVSLFTVIFMIATWVAVIALTLPHAR
jgi:hypothetical protein